MRRLFTFFFLLTVPILGFADEIYDLSPEYKPGQRFAYAGELSIGIDSKTISPNEMDMNMKWRVRGDFDVSVAKLDDDGSVDLKVKISQPNLGFSMKGLLPGGVNFAVDLDTDQEEPMPNEVYEMIQNVVKSLDQEVFTVVLDKNGDLVDIKDFEAVINNLEARIGSAGCVFLDEKTAVQFLSTFTTYLPGHSVKVGETWISTHEIMPGYQENWKLESAEGNRLVVKNNSELTGETIQGFINEVPGKMEEGSGNVSETVVLDQSTRAIISVNGDASFSGKQTIAGPEEMKSDIKVDYRARIVRKGA